MDQPIVQGLLTFLGGAVVAGFNALLSARLLEKKPAAFASFSAVRQLFNVAYLVLVFFGSRALGWDVTALSMVFAMLLARRNDKKSKSAAADKKGEDLNG